MSALDDKNNLPGVLVDIENEITQEFDPSKWGNTDSVVIIGTAFSGPVNQPIKVYNSDMANYIFGASYNATTKLLIVDVQLFMQSVLAEKTFTRISNSAMKTTQIIV